MDISDHVVETGLAVHNTVILEDAINCTPVSANYDVIYLRREKEGEYLSGRSYKLYSVVVDMFCIIGVVGERVRILFDLLERYRVAIPVSLAFSKPFVR